MKAEATITVANLAGLVGVSSRRLYQMAEEGEIPKPAEGRFPTRATLKALFTYFRQKAVTTGNDLRTQRAREAKARANLLELKQAEREGSLVPRPLVYKTVEDVFLPLRTQLLAMPATLSYRCNPTDPEIARKAIHETIHDILEAAADAATPG